MMQFTKNPGGGNVKAPLFSERYSENEVRSRIQNYIICGGVMPISPTGVHNIGRLFRIPVELVQRLIREESAKIGNGKEVTDAK